MPSPLSIEYVLDAAQLVDACCRRLMLLNGHEKLAPDLAMSIASTEKLIHVYIHSLLDSESETESDDSSSKSSSTSDGYIGNDDELEQSHMTSDSVSKVTPLMISATRLQVYEATKEYCQHKTSYRDRISSSGKKLPLTLYIPSKPISFYPKSNEKMDKTRHRRNEVFHPRANSREVERNTLLLRLISCLRLCLYRIEDADIILSDLKGARERSERLVDELCAEEFVISRKLFQGTHMGSNIQRIGLDPITGNSQQGNILRTMAFVGLLSLGSFSVSKYSFRRKGLAHVIPSLKLVAAGVSIIFGYKKLLFMQAKARLLDSASTLKRWQQTWIISVNSICSNALHPGHHKTLDDGPSRHLLDFVPIHNTGQGIWYNEDALRFLFVRRAMDLIYASIGTAMDYTGPEGSFGLWVPIACAAASYYAMAGGEATSDKAAKVTRSPDSAKMMKKSWGCVSLSAVKRMSLRVSRILKRASCAEKVEIAGIPCFILSKRGDSSLSTAVQRFHRQSERKLSRLPTIKESFEEEDENSHMIRRHAAPHHDAFPTKDVILHLTGGGWFSHTIAGDIPFLLDWSDATDAVVICPEYSLLPKETFPKALNEIFDVYCSLTSNDIAPLLGFEVNRIIVTGESSGGNLAAALCVKILSIGMPFLDEDGVAANEKATENYFQLLPGKGKSTNTKQLLSLRMPDGLLLGSPTLNLSFPKCMRPSVHGNDPVMPMGLLNAISQVYVPESCKLKRKNPLISPIYASEDILESFPPSLLYVCADDPNLTDSVAFNTRLKRVGVSCDLRYVPHLPHSFWGLATAGFPEAQNVQAECCAWLCERFCEDEA